MIEVSLLLFTLMVEALVVSLVILLIWIGVAIKNKKRDQAAVKALVDQIKNQSQTRLENTESFLVEKYGLEGNGLHSTAESIDKAEKKFMQEIINMYLHRDAQRLTSMDALIAEMVDAYKSPAPAAAPGAESIASSSDTEQQLAELKDVNAKLVDELRITKENMNSMAREFGNMFGGGKDSRLDPEDVAEKVIVSGKTASSNEADAAMDDIEIATEETIETPLPQDEVATENIANEQKEEPVTQDKKKSPQQEELDEEDVDELLNSIDLSDTK